MISQLNKTNLVAEFTKKNLVGRIFLKGKPHFSLFYITNGTSIAYVRIQ